MQEGQAAHRSFYIFISARKERPTNAEKRIRIQIESASPELPNTPPPNAIQAEGFLKVLGKIWPVADQEKGSIGAFLLFDGAANLASLNMA